MMKLKRWAVMDVGPWPKNEQRVWGPFETKKEARAWAKESLCDCCSHKVMPLYDRRYEGDWDE